MPSRIAQAAVAGCLGIIGSTAMPAHVAAQPNILFIMADDVGVEAFDAYMSNPVNTAGTNGGISTPNISNLASTGIQYTHAYAQPLCTPSRVEVMTGVYNFRNYRSFGYLDNDQTTFAHVAQDNGYATAIAGKWQLSDPALSITPTGPTAPNITPAVMSNDYGFDSYLLWQLNNTDTTGDKGSRYWDPKLETASNDGTTSVIVSTAPSDYGPDLFTNHLKNFMTASVNNNQPFLAYYPMALPHDPWVSTPDAPGATSGDNEQYFDENIEYVDKLVGELVSHVDSLNVRNDTIIIFTSDNGTSPRISIQTDDGTVPGDKGINTNYGTHVPFIINWQGHTVAGTSDRMVDLTDVFSTMIEAGGWTAPANLELDGKPIIDANGQQLNNKDVAYSWYDPKGRPFPSSEWAQNTQYKLYADGRFFDIDNDPGEQIDLSSSTLTQTQQTAYDQLQGTLDFYYNEQFPPVPPAEPLDPTDSSVNASLEARFHQAATDLDLGAAGFDAHWLDQSGQGNDLVSYAGRTVAGGGTPVDPADADPTVGSLTFNLSTGGAIVHDVAQFADGASELMRADLLGDDTGGEQSFDELMVFLVYSINTDLNLAGIVRPAGIGSYRDSDNGTSESSADNFNLSADGSIRLDNGSIASTEPSADEQLMIRAVRMSPGGGVDQWFHLDDGRGMIATINDGPAFTTRDDDLYIGDLRVDEAFQIGDDFSIAELIVYKSALTDEQIAGIDAWLFNWYFPYAGDANRDQTVNIGDLTLLAGNFGTSGKTWQQGDFNGDGLVNIGDLTILAGNFGSSVTSSSATTVPEPASLVLLLSGLVLLKRK